MRVSKITVATVFLLTVMVFFTMTFSDDFDVPTFGGDVGPAFAPRGYLRVWMVLAALALIQAVKQEDAPLEEIRDLRRILLASAIAVGVGLSMLKIGFVFAAIPGFFLFCLTLGYRNYPVLIVLSILAPLAIWLTFTFVFELLLPRSTWITSAFGELWRWNFSM
ncbi:MAG: tripartite tricarboxylate transporter TctB family protein [Geminicoccaceae bacterium]